MIPAELTSIARVPHDNPDAPRMPITGLVLGLEPRDDASEAAVRALRDDERIDIGSAPGTNRIPVVIETETAKEARSLMRWIGDRPGVATVELAYVDYAGADYPPPGGEGAS